MARGVLLRSVLRRDGGVTESIVSYCADAPDGDLPRGDAELLVLRSGERPRWPQGQAVTVVDLFSGCGGLSLGVGQALAALGVPARFVGVDIDSSALAVYARNLPDSQSLPMDLATGLDGTLGDDPTMNEQRFSEAVGTCEILVAGPPCQGHSAANNRTRHTDRRNELYMRVVRAAELLCPEHVLIENVPGAVSDRNGVVNRAIAQLRRLGYDISTGVVDASEIGVPQRRRRLVLLASRSIRPDVSRVTNDHRLRVPRSVRWALEDLQNMEPQRLVDEPARSAPQTRKRIDVLFDRGLHELPDEHRPPCHARGGHSYVSIYGRLRWDEPAQTLTTGFYSMCMGRTVHPSRRRTITAHEAARIQGFPDWFSFDDVTKRVDLARMIGNAVPPHLGYVAGLELLR